VRIPLSILYGAMLCFCCLTLQGCHRHPEIVISGNQSLRLTPEEVRANTERARHGDAEAAHKLWEHYEFGVYDHDRGEYWKAQYERLRKSDQ
jgi:hypothetical protein